MALPLTFLIDTNVLAYAYDRSEVENYLRAWTILPVTPMIVQEAVRGTVIHGFSYWDAQIWATARLNQIPIVLSEDFAHGQRIEGVHFLNPFMPEVELPL